MRYPLLFFTLLSFASACNKRPAQTEQATTASTKTASDTACYRQVTGRDSVTLRLVMNGADVTGELAVLPHEKDQARGPIRGELRGNQIRADWQRSGEGVVQPHELVFSLKGDAITWREGERVEKQGRWVLNNPAQGYAYQLLKTDCP